jgi:hypothetical protein
MGHYGFTQNVLYGVVMAMNSLPCNYVLFTALESRTEDDDRSTIYGPQIAGKKATALVPSWVGDCLHFQDYPVERVSKVKNAKTGQMDDITTVETLVHAYFIKHPDPATGIMFPAKPRVTPERIRDLIEVYPGGFFVPTPEEGFDTYLHKVDALQKGQGDSVKAWRDAVDAKHGRTKKIEAKAEPRAEPKG